MTSLFNRDSEMSEQLNISSEDYSLLTDLYQLTMAACYRGENVHQKRACFEVFTRRLPEGFGYAIAMGLEQVLEYLENFRFDDNQIEALQKTGIFDSAPAEFWTLLAEGKFTGDVWAVPEGTAVFAFEPLLRIEAPLWQAQLVETYLLNTLNYQTLIATRAARARDVAGEKTTLLEFGTRRAFSPQASLWAARAALGAGFDATSNVLAALKLGEKPSGTMAHALVMALCALEGSEEKAFSAFHQYFPGAPLLIDTYDTIAAARELAVKVKAGEIKLTGVRIDSGDLVALSKQVKEILPNVSVFASGDIDEWEISRLKNNNAQIDGYGIGTRLVTGKPVNGVYKLVEIEGIPVMKQSRGKVSYPGRKQIFREFVKGGLKKDTLGLVSENYPEKQPLLKLFMKNGRRLEAPCKIQTIRKRTAATLASLSPQIRNLDFRNLDSSTSEAVEISTSLQQLTEQTNKGNGEQGTGNREQGTGNSEQ